MNHIEMKRNIFISIIEQNFFPFNLTEKGENKVEGILYPAKPDKSLRKIKY
jgi:hypothetical protein